MGLNHLAQQELAVLAMYDDTTTQAGIKIRSDASPLVIAAARRLFKKGLITQEDGGYLTPLGFEAATSFKNVLRILD
ncbi:MAG: TIGR02647 family protein [Cellvibrio sp.]